MAEREKSFKLHGHGMAAETSEGPLCPPLLKSSEIHDVSVAKLPPVVLLDAKDGALASDFKDEKKGYNLLVHIATCVSSDLEEKDKIPPVKKQKLLDFVEESDGDSDGDGDGHSDSDSDSYCNGERLMNREEADLYNQQIRDSEGFHVGYFPNTYAYGRIQPILNIDGCQKTLNNLSELAIKHYNEENNANYQFVKVMSANSQTIKGINYYITFEAKDPGDGQVKNFQALVNQFLDEVVDFCRLEPTNPTNCYGQGKHTALWDRWLYYL